MSTEALCSQEWEKYLKTTGEHKDGWEVILDDSRNVNINKSMSFFLAHFTDLMENLFMGCKEVMSESVHRELVDVAVKRMEELINFDYSNYSGKRFYQVVPLLRSTDDCILQRKTEMIVVMVVRVSVVPKSDRNETPAQIENSIKVRMRSKSDNTVPVRAPPYKPST